MRVLVTGAAGQVGSEVAAVCAGAGDEVTAVDRAALDITDRDAVLGLLGAVRPEVVINTAAFTAVDRCESEIDQAFLVNALAVRWLREGADRCGAHLVHVSTDYVFDGSQAAPYREWDPTGPASVYGASKLGGEREAGPDATVVRTSWVCGRVGSNMVKTVLRLAADQPELAFVDDQFGCPTFAADLAPMLRRLGLERRSGIHHVTNQGAVSWFEFVRAIVDEMGADVGKVRGIPTSELQPPRPAPRPANSVLDNWVLRSSGLPLLRDFHAPLGELVRLLLE